MPGLPVLLFVVFLVLKLVNVIDWSWWWVTAPLWIPALIVAVMWVAAIFLGGIAWVLGDRK